MMTKREVVIVIVSLAIIGSLGWQMLTCGCPAPMSAQMSQCRDNLKQFGVVRALYEGDNKENCPGPQPMGIGIPEISWDRPLAIQMGTRLGSGSAGIYEPLANLTRISIFVPKSMDGFACPVDAQVKGAQAIPKIPGSLADGTAPGTGICRSYVMNLGTGNLVAGTDDGITPTANAVPAKKIESAAGTIYLIESHGYATVFGQRNIANDTYITCDKTGVIVPKDAFTNPLVPMHKGEPKSRFNLPYFGPKPEIRVNALMYDGHVELLEQSSITADGGKIMQYVKERMPATQ